MKYIIQKHSTELLVIIVGQLIAEGYGTYRPRLKADDFSERVVVQGSAYWCKCRWQNGAEGHEIELDVRPLGETDDRDSVQLDRHSSAKFGI